MNSALHSPRPIVAHKRFVQPLWLASLGWLVACSASVAVAGASIPQAGWAGGIASPAPVTKVAVAEGTSPPLMARCRTCGIVETVRRFQAAGATPAGYEMTVRLRDGSRRISSQSDSARWRVGDSIMLLGGAKLPGRV